MSLLNQKLILENSSNKVIMNDPIINAALESRDNELKFEDLNNDTKHYPPIDPIEA